MSFHGSQSYQTVIFSLEWRMLHQVVNIFQLLGVLVLQKSSKILLCVSLEVEPGPCPKAALLFFGCYTCCLCIPSLPWLATVWTCPLECGAGLGGWSLFPTNKKQGTQKGFHAQEPHGVLLGFSVYQTCVLFLGQDTLEHIHTLTEIPLKRKRWWCRIEEKYCRSHVPERARSIGFWLKHKSWP